MNLKQLLDEVDLPQTAVADDAWDLARHQERRRRAAAGALIAAVIAAVVVVVSLPGHRTRIEPSRPSPSPSPSTPAPHAVRWPTPFTTKAWERLAAAPELVVSEVADLSTDPVPAAALAMTDPNDPAGVLVLGEDGGWRRVDAPLVESRDANGYSSPTLQPTSLSADATRLALPQPHELVVVDLPTATVHRIDLPGFPDMVSWVDSDHVLAWTQEGQTRGMLVDIATGTWAPSRRTSSTRFLPDGSWLAWGFDPHAIFFHGIEESHGRTLYTEANNEASCFPEPPLVTEDAVVGHGSLSTSGVRGGAVVVDRHTGESLAFQPTGPGTCDPAALLGLDGDAVLLSLHNPNISAAYTVVVRWDWRSGPEVPLEPIVRVPVTQNLVWGTGMIADAPTR